jgi:hypothetical protein
MGLQPGCRQHLGGRQRQQHRCGGNLSADSSAYSFTLDTTAPVAPSNTPAH